MVLGGILIAILVGFRYEVGADWPSYQFIFDYARHADFGRMLEVGDPAYQALNWGVKRLGVEIWLVNLVCGSIFAWGLVRFAQVQANPWTAILVSVPYMIVVVAMGYSRQAVALGIVMAGLASISRGGSLIRFAVYVACAALFHKSAVIAFPIVVLASERNRALNLLVGVFLSVFFYDMFLSESMEQFVQHYIEAEYSSQGALIRVVMSLVPAAVFLLFQRRLGFSPDERGIWRNFSLAAFALLVLLIVLPSSTAVDRIAIYIMPLQLAVLSRVPGALMARGAGKAVVIGYSLLVQLIWLNFASHAQYWVPYRLYPLG